MTEQQWDKKLKIHTCGRDDFHSDEYHYPYEPTPYTVLERLVESEYITSDNVVIDYGCGKGFAIAEQNKNTSHSSNISFLCKMLKNMKYQLQIVSISSTHFL